LFWGPSASSLMDNGTAGGLKLLSEYMLQCVEICFLSLPAYKVE
jgi:hypothetical protein